MTGLRWGFSFLLGNSLISDDQKLKLVTEATMMYLAGQDRLEISGAGDEGVLHTKREWKVIGGFSGQQFDAEIETERDEGKVRLRFLVSEQTFRHAESTPSLN